MLEVKTCYETQFNTPRKLACLETENEEIIMYFIMNEYEFGSKFDSLDSVKVFINSEFQRGSRTKYFVVEIVAGYEPVYPTVEFKEVTKADFLELGYERESAEKAIHPL